MSRSLGGIDHGRRNPRKSDDSNTCPATANPEDADIGPCQAKLEAQFAFLEPKTWAKILRVFLFGGMMCS